MVTSIHGSSFCINSIYGLPPPISCSIIFWIHSVSFVAFLLCNRTCHYLLLLYQNFDCDSVILISAEISLFNLKKTHTSSGKLTLKIDNIKSSFKLVYTFLLLSLFFPILVTQNKQFCNIKLLSEFLEQ